VISAVQPSELLLFGPFVKTYAEEFKNLVPKIAPLYDNDQPTLF
jgi:hypothetical protein